MEGYGVKIWLNRVQELHVGMTHLRQPLVWLSLLVAVVLPTLFCLCMRNNRARATKDSGTNISKASPHTINESEDLSLPVLTPKHKIFLSHSRAQKPFVEQLCKDLEASCHYPFFDQRDDCLPKGKKFASLIFDAAKQCRVGMVVLSENYLTSRWPMQELVEFVKAKNSVNKSLELLPLFFQLPVDDLSDECISSRWMPEWTKMAKNDPKSRVDVEQWKRAVQELRAVNGLAFAEFKSEVSYREDVVKAIFKLVPPDLLYDSSEVQGCDRMCKILSGMFVEHTRYTRSGDSRSRQPKKLGLYGMGGLGKTTMCKALCNHFQTEFHGRVCHVELGSEAPLVLQKNVLRKLLRVREEVLQNITDISEGRKCLKENMKLQPVFLVVDNVGDEDTCRSEAQAYLDAGFNPGSKIMVTSRSRDIVQRLLRDPEYCKPIPDLMMDEAVAIFLHKAAPGKIFSSLERKEKRIVNLCVEQCRFSPDGGPYADLKKDGQYHPLALGALGVYFNDIDSSDLLLWEDHLGDFDKLKLSRECPRIFLILGLQFSTFDKTKKLIFLDVALYAHGQIRWELDSFEVWVDWLAALHKVTDKVVKHKLSDLERNAMINKGESVVTTHDLYKEYAEWYVKEGHVKEGVDAKDWCVFQKHGDDLPRELKRSPPGGCWPDLERISMVVGLKCMKIPSKKVLEWRNIVVLQLHSCTNLTDLDLHGLSCLCHLELVGLEKLERLTFSDVDDGATEYPLDLEFVILKELKGLKWLPNFSPCTLLRMFILKECRSLMEPLNLESCSCLKILQVDWYPTQLHAPNLSAMTMLQELCIMNPEKTSWDLIQLEGLSSLINLQKKLYLFRLPVERLPGLQMLTKLHALNLEQCPLTELPDLSALIHLKMLNVAWTNIKEIQGVEYMLQLQTLDCRGCHHLLWLPNLDHLPSLRHLNTQGCSKMKSLPRVPKHHCVHDKDEQFDSRSHSRWRHFWDNLDGTDFLILEGG